MAYYYDDSNPMNMYRQAMQARLAGGRPQRFDEYYRVYPTVMMPGPERESVNHGGKMFLPVSALDKLTQLHITYPMLFELTNGAQGKSTHAGVLEFTAEEGRCYLPHWLMQTLALERGDLLQAKSTDLPLGSFIKLQPQNTNFLDITDPRAVLETAFRNFSCLTIGDVFTFSYNDTIYEIAVLEVKPDGEKHAVSVQETDLEVDFAPPVGWEEELAKKKVAAAAGGSGTSTPRSIGSTMASKGGMLHADGTMAQSINYAAIAPTSTTDGQPKASVNFSSAGNRLVAKKGKSKSAAQASSTSTPRTSTPDNSAAVVRTARRRDGPQALRLPPGKLFFGYEIKPVKKKGEAAEGDQENKVHFKGEGQTLRKTKDQK